MIACKLEFECTNNVAEYEALVQGLRKAIDMGAKAIECVGDSEIIVKQVWNQIHCLYPHLVNYQILIRYMTSSFSTFNIRSVPRSQNFDANLLANIASRLIPLEGLSPQTFSIKLMNRPSIPDNVTNLKVFDDDHQILEFLSAQNTFKGMAIVEANHEKSLSDPSNIIPKSSISMEKFYDLQEKFRQTINCKTQSLTLNHTPINL